MTSSFTLGSVSLNALPLLGRGSLEQAAKAREALAHPDVLHSALLRSAGARFVVGSP